MPEEGTGRYSKYMTAIETVIGFIVVNISYILAGIFDTDVIGFRWKVTLLAVNVSFIPSAYFLSFLKRTRTIHIDRIVKAGTISVFIHMLFFFSVLTFLDSWVHNPSFYLWFYGLLFILLPGCWVAYRKLLKTYRSHGYNYRTVAIIGTGETARRLKSEMLDDPGYGYRVVGLFASDGNSHDIGAPDVIGTIDTLPDYLSKNVVNEIYYTLADEDRTLLKKVIDAADNHFATFYYVPPMSLILGRGSRLDSIGTVPVLSLRSNPLGLKINRFLKRGFDICFSVTAIALTSVIAIPVAVAIKLSSPGPVLFLQKRTGYQGNEFDCYKFRTMRPNSDSDSRQAVKGDDRITPIGRFLRKTSLDELPQFFNVLKGDMSVVGPRPHMLKHTRDYTRLIDKYMMRHFVKPGITGWAQIRGFRGETKELWQMEKRVESDVWYIENWSFLLDLKIIAMTVIKIFSGDEKAF